mgnify:CR=1 FL=1
MTASNEHNSSKPERIRLRVLGISYSQIQAGAYALILAQTEAQSIAIKMEGIIPPRPMTHDLFTSLAQAYGIELKDVFIHKFEDGIFSSELTFEDRNGREVMLDARTSDAIAIAMRTRTPIFTTPEILEETGFIMEIKEEGATAGTPGNDADESDPYAGKTPEELERIMRSHIENEEYEEAAKIKAILTTLRGDKD